jgi:hypothetical protein
MRRLVLAVLLSIACGGRPGIPVAESDSTDWPFTVTAGTLRCEVNGPRKMVTLDTGTGIYYGLNGAARGFGYPDGLKILKPDKTGADVQPYITKGLTLCP